MDELVIHLHSRGGRPTTAEARAVDVVRSRLETYAKHLRRVAVRVDQRINNHGTIDQTCRIEVSLLKVADAPSFVVEGRATTPKEAADLAADGVEGAVRRELEDTARRRRSKIARRRGERSPRVLEVQRQEAVAIAAAEKEAELERGRHHQTPRAVKTAHPPRGRHIHMTQRQSRATSAREVSATSPSRKSTRKSANRSKRDSNQARRTERDVRSPEARARASAARVRGRRSAAPA